MKIAILSDVHANSPALESVLRDAENREVESVRFLGDVVGYGPDVTIALKWLKGYLDPEHWVMGNHEQIWSDMLPPKDIGLDAVDAIRLNKRTVQEEDPELADFATDNFSERNLPPVVETINGFDIILSHYGQEHNAYSYIFPWDTRNLRITTELQRLQKERAKTKRTRILFLGHTHIPMLVQAPARELKQEKIKITPVEYETPYKVDKGVSMINPGSVGQPRDTDRRASYAILDSDRSVITFHRVTYPWREVARRLQKLDYPENLVTRLKYAGLPKKATPQWVEHFTSIPDRDADETDSEQ